MDAKKYYNERDISHRRLTSLQTIRNSHNFIKAVLIQTFLKEKQKILDLGCGQGGDLLKLKLSRPSLYVGIDIAPNSIMAAQHRCSKIKLHCRCTFLCLDFTKENWGDFITYGVINCQFAIQYAFICEKSAHSTFKKIAAHLVEGGFFIGSIPLHEDCNTYDEVLVKLPGDERLCKEYVINKKDLIDICQTYNLELIVFEKFAAYFETCKQTHAELAEKMRVTENPDPKNAIFVFQKCSKS
tara:strand:+ start:1545 stop:2267 length:723 start_codon:yes stop_codon:yes gene_type:complete